MNASTIAQLIISLGPVALDLIPKLTALWSKPVLTLDEVNTICAVTKTSYDTYIANARAALGQ